MTGRTKEPLIVPHPRETATLVGQDRAWQVMADAVRRERQPSGWLLTGRAGIGKATLAYRFARILLAGTGRQTTVDQVDIDPTDPVFRRIAAGSHPNLLTVEREYDEERKRLRSDLLVGQIRRIGTFLHQTSTDGGWRIVVVDSIDRSTVEAQNAVLKILEEPPPRSVLVLTATVPGRLLPTVRSRCRTVRLSPLSNELVHRSVRRHVPDLPSDDVDLIATLSAGSIGRALSLVTADAATMYREILHCFEHLPTLDWQRIHRIGDQWSAVGDLSASATGADLLLGLLARLIRYAAAPEPAAVVEREAALARRLLAPAGPVGPPGLDRWLDLWDKLRSLFDRADSVNLGSKQVVLSAFHRIQQVAGA